MPPGARGRDALDAAGGPLDEANLEAFNLARPLQDGEQLRLPFMDESSSGQAQFPININTTQAIADCRNFHGPFTEPAEIQNVSGIGPSTFADIEDLIVAE